MIKFLGKYKIFFLDEAQRVKNIGLNLKILHDTYPNIQIIATGSSSFELANNISEPMTGRCSRFMLYPLSLQEIKKENDYIIEKSTLNNILRFGLYPEIFNKSEQEAKTKLEEIVSNYLYKDVLEFEKIKKSDQLFNILKLLAFQIGNQVSYQEIANKLDLNIATIEKYIYLLEQSFVIFRLYPFSKNLRNDLGVLWENFCVIERIKYLKYQQKFVNQYFWRTYTQKEIDLVEEKNGKLFAYEFKWNVNQKKKIKPPKEFLDTYQNSSFKVIDQDNYDKFLL